MHTHEHIKHIKTPKTHTHTLIYTNDICRHQMSSSAINFVRRFTDTNPGIKRFHPFTTTYKNPPKLKNLKTHEEDVKSETRVEHTYMK